MQGDYRNSFGGGDKSVWVVLLEIAKLLCLLIWKGIKALGRLILKGLKLLLKWTVKGLLWLIDATRWLSRKIRDFWNDNNTQEKLHKIGRALKKGALAALYGIWIAIVYVGKALVWLLKKLFVGLLHLKTTLKITGRWIGKTSVRFWKWIKRQGVNLKSWWAKKKKQYRSFRRNQGFKGLLIDMRDAMRGSISNYIENDQQNDQLADNAIADDSVMSQNDDSQVVADDDDNEDEEDVKGVRKFGRKIYKAMKRLVEV